MKEVIILPEDTEKLIDEVEVKLYKAKDQYYRSKESAIYSLITHNKCECGNLMRRGHLKCESCRSKKREEVYNSMSFMEWDGVTPLVLFDSDIYFFGEDDIYDYIYNEELDSDQIDNLQLVICQPNHFNEIDLDYWGDIFPEDFDAERSIPEFIKKLDEFNKFISEQEPISWSEGKFRTKVKLEFN
jgi:hypothetical protein